MFGWTYIDGTGEEAGASHRFGDRESAEDWIGQSGRSLTEFGVAEVVLIDHHQGRPLYRMGLVGAE